MLCKPIVILISTKQVEDLMHVEHDGLKFDSKSLYVLETAVLSCEVKLINITWHHWVLNQSNCLKFHIHWVVFNNWKRTVQSW